MKGFFFLFFIFSVRFWFVFKTMNICIGFWKPEELLSVYLELASELNNL